MKSNVKLKLQSLSHVVMHRKNCVSSHLQILSVRRPVNAYYPVVIHARDCVQHCVEAAKLKGLKLYQLACTRFGWSAKRLQFHQTVMDLVPRNCHVDTFVSSAAKTLVLHNVRRL